MRFLYLFFVLLLSISITSTAQWTSSRPDGHAPLGVMGDHTHGAGEFMLSYRFRYMNMDGNRGGSDGVSSTDVVDPNNFNFVFMHGFTYLGQAPDWSWGIQAGGVLRFGENDYSLGNKFMLTTWGARKLSKWVSASARIEANSWGNVSGASPAFAGAVNMRMVPTVFPEMRGGSRIDAGLGINTSIGGSLSGLQFAVEALLPVAQNLDGPQLETDLQVIACGMRFEKGVYWLSVVSD